MPNNKIRREEENKVWWCVLLDKEAEKEEREKNRRREKKQQEQEQEQQEGEEKQKRGNGKEKDGSPFVKKLKQQMVDTKDRYTLTPSFNRLFLSLSLSLSLR